MTAPTETTEPDLIDFYRELNVDRDCTIAELQTEIQQAQLGWRNRSSLVGKRVEKARRVVEMVEQAAQAFASEDTKEEYDRRLRKRTTSEIETSVNWVNRAWMYYFLEDYGPANVAARKARQRRGPHSSCGFCMDRSRRGRTPTS